MTTIEKLADYRRALERYRARKKVFDAEEANGKSHRKPFAEVYPLPEHFEMKNEDSFAERILKEVMKNRVIVPRRKI